VTSPGSAPAGGRRLAWFTPLPPVRSGIAAYNAELLPRLAGSYAIDVFVEGHEGTGAGLRVFDAHDFLWRNALHPYDLTVYQVGNETCHDYLWPYLVRYPGLVVLHDGMLHHARARNLLARRRLDDYRAELRFNHPDTSAGVSEIGALGRLGLLQYFWPMLRVPVTTARLVAVHNPWLAQDLSEEFPDARVETIRMGVTDPIAAASGRGGAVSGSAAVRDRHAIPSDAVVFAAFGRVTPEKRIRPAIRALAAAASHGARVHLLLMGEPAARYDVMAEAERCGASELVTVTGYVSDEELPAHLLAADVCLCLRWPAARETSASWLRCLAAGKPTVVTNLAHTVDVAALDPRSWRVLPPAVPAACADRPSPDPACVAIDILDEQHSLALAVERLAGDEALRARLGAAARAHVERGHTLAHMTDDYRRIIETALSEPALARLDQVRASLPPHLLDDATARARALAGEAGAAVDFLDE
jgi:glycosyltransferase involved in cell wall biosynthesis